MEKLVFSASNGKHVPSGGGHYLAHGEQWQSYHGKGMYIERASPPREKKHKEKRDA